VFTVHDIYLTKREGKSLMRKDLSGITPVSSSTKIVVIYFVISFIWILVDQLKGTIDTDKLQESGIKIIFPLQ